MSYIPLLLKSVWIDFSLKYNDFQWIQHFNAGVQECAGFTGFSCARLLPAMAAPFCILTIS